MTSYFPQSQYAARYAGSVPLTLVNDTAQQACYFRMSPVTDGGWGDDWLGATEIVHPGAVRTFYVAPNQTWNVRVEACSHAVLGEAHGIAVAGAGQLPLSRMIVAWPTVPLVAAASPVAGVQATMTTNVNLGAGTQGDDVLSLHDGTLLRGRVAEMHPGQHVTMVLLTGQTREIEWSDLATMAGPSFPQRTP